MVHIVSKRDGPRREDAQARHFIDQNRATIEKLADQLTGGPQWRQRLRPPTVPAAGAQSQRVRIGPAPAGDAAARPYIRISANNRVVMADLETGRQLSFLGEIRGRRGERRFVLATADNGFFAPLDGGTAERLHDLDGRPLPDEAAEEAFRADLSVRLGCESL